MERDAERQKKANKVEQYVSFVVGGEFYGLDVMRIAGIEKPGKIRNVPGASEHIKGLMDVRGHMVPIISLRSRLKISAAEPEKERRIIIVETGMTMIGLEVDDVREVFQTERDKIKNVPLDGKWRIDNEYIFGVTRLDDNLVIILDPDKVCTEDEIKAIIGT